MIKELLATKMAEPNKIAILNINLMMNMKAVMQLLQKHQGVLLVSL